MCDSVVQSWRCCTRRAKCAVSASRRESGRNRGRESTFSVRSIILTLARSCTGPQPSCLLQNRETWWLTRAGLRPCFRAKFGREDGIGGKVGRWGLVVSSTVEALGGGNRSVDDQSNSIWCFSIDFIPSFEWYIWNSYCNYCERTYLGLIMEKLNPNNIYKLRSRCLPLPTIRSPLPSKTLFMEVWQHWLCFHPACCPPLGMKLQGSKSVRIFWISLIGRCLLSILP